jgi:Rab5 GDP/GTP exchange factor
MIPPRPVTADDLERDRVLRQRIALFGWVEEKHLDIPEGEGSKGFMMFAQQGTNLTVMWMIYFGLTCFIWTELLKINHYKAPRDKLICILNCCKVIFGPPHILSSPFTH